MRFRLIDAAKENSPSNVSCKVSWRQPGSAKLPGRDQDQPAVDRMRTWCCWPIFARPLHCRTQPTAAFAIKPPARSLLKAAWLPLV